MKKIIRVTTVPTSLSILLKGQLKFMSQYYNVVGVSTPGNVLEEVREREGVSVFSLDMTRKITPIKDLIAIYKLYKFLIKNKPDIIHSHTPKAGMVSMLSSWLARTPNRLHTVAGLPLLEAKGIKRLILNLVEKITYRCATKVYPNSKVLKDIIIENKLSTESKLKVLGNGSSNGIDTSFFDSKNISQSTLSGLREELKICSSDFIFTFVGRIVKDKGINELIESFVEINKKNSNTKLLLVGPFEDDLDPIKLSNKHLIKNMDSILSVGYVSDVRPYMVLSNVLVFPSYREGFPNVVMQAASLGLPCIVSDINGCNEIISENYNGVIVPPKDKVSLEKAMSNILKDKNQYLFFKSNARLSIVERFEQSFVWNEILKEYKKIS